MASELLSDSYVEHSLFGTSQEFSSLPDAGKMDFVDSQSQPLLSRLPGLEHLSPLFRDKAVDFLDGLLRLSASKRMTAREALDHVWLADEPILIPKNYTTPGTYDPPDPSAILPARFRSDVDGRTIEDMLESYFDIAAATHSLTALTVRDD